MKRATRDWIRKAEADFQLASQIDKARYPDQICFLCQQSTEKYLKAILEEASLRIPRIHDLDQLLLAMPNQHLTLKRTRRGALFLTQFAIAARYPGFSANRRQATAALRWSLRFRTICRTILGLK
jgi:HEPN domain-containing protein